MNEAPVQGMVRMTRAGNCRECRMSCEELDWLAGNYGRAARRARKAGDRQWEENAEDRCADCAGQDRCLENIGRQSGSG